MFEPSEKVKKLKQSEIRSASKRCLESGGINLGQGLCDMPIPEVLKQAAMKAVGGSTNLYSSHQGLLELRQAIATKMKQFNQVEVNPETEVMITHGSTGAFVCAVMTLFNPGDEVILFEPFYGYHKHVLEINGIIVKTVSINARDFTLDWQSLSDMMSMKTKGLVICTPCNPSGKVFTKSELTRLGELAKEHECYVITDEIYEYITYPGFSHISLASLQDFHQFTVTISGFSKTYNMTGWRLGYAIAPPEILERMALVQDYLYICPATPLQHAVLPILNLPQTYYSNMQKSYLTKRDGLCQALTSLGFHLKVPEGAYYVLVDVRGAGFENDLQAAEILLDYAKIAVVPGRAFYSEFYRGQHLIRLCFALEEAKILQAIDQLVSVDFESIIQAQSCL